MKICVITERFYPDTCDVVSILFTQLLRCLKDNHGDLEIHVISSSSPTRRFTQKLEIYDDWGGIKIHRMRMIQTKRNSSLLRLGLGAIFSLLSFLKIYQLNRYEKYDIILVATNPPILPLAGYLMSKYFSVPYLYVVHDLFLEIAVQMGAIQISSILHKVAQKCQRSWLNESARIIVPGRCMKLKLIDIYEVPANKISVITNWSDTDKIFPMSKNTSFRKKNNYDGFILMYAGNIGRSQKLETVIEAANNLAITHPYIKFLFVGDGQDKQHLVRMVDNYNLHNVSFLAEVMFQNYPELLASADVGLVSLGDPYNGLAVPSKTYNILASGRPMISISKQGSEIAEMIRENYCGINVEPDNVRQLVAEIIKLYDAGSLLLQEMGQVSRATCVKKYSLQVVSNEYYQLLLEILVSHTKRNAV